MAEQQSTNQLLTEIPVIGIFVTILLLFFKRSTMLNNRWILLFLGLVGLWGIIWRLWQYVSIWLLLPIGTILTIVFTIWQWMYYKRKEPINESSIAKWINTDSIKKWRRIVAIWINRVLCLVEIVGMIFLVFYDYDKNIITPIVWRTIAVVLFAEVVYLYSDRKKK